ncbi:MAG: hypothetical protein LIO65_03570 [Odoribacter sp.]|nr:hypothetical protein [Odoribacter sp.]
MKPKNLLGILFLSLFARCCISCSDDDKEQPISLKDWESNKISLVYPDTTSYHFTLQGGDGNYHVQSNKPEIIRAELMSSGKILKLTPLDLGAAVVTITDDSENSLELQVTSDYHTLNIGILEHNVRITGDLRESEKEEIREKALKTIPVEIGGGYKFIYTQYGEDYRGAGTVVIYPKEFGKDAIEGTFKEARVDITIGEQENTLPVYYLDIDGETTELFIVSYQQFAPRDMVVQVAFMQDVTDIFKEDYPHVEGVYTLQLIGNPK